MTSKKVIHSVGLILVLIAIISLFISLYDYNTTYNIWAEKEDSFTNVIVIVSVILVVVAIATVIMISANKKVRKITKGKPIKKPNAESIKRNSTHGILSSIFEIILFLIVSEEMVCKFGVRTLDMNFAEAEFLAGGYQIFKNHFLFIAVITIIQDIVNYFTAESQVDNFGDSNYNDKQIYGNEIKVKTYSEEPSYIICPSCGFEQPKGRKVCWKCNIKLNDPETTDNTISKCPNCGAKTTEEMLFCGNCGNKIKE